MNTICRRIQDTLAVEGAQALREDDVAQRHLADCADCFAALESLNELYVTLEALPQIDAPDDAVDRLLALGTRKGLASPRSQSFIAFTLVGHAG